MNNGVLITPPPSDAGALEGITQDTVVTIAKDLGYEVRFETMLRTDIYLADEGFLTGTAAEVVPISSVDDRLLADGKPGPITKRIQEAYFEAVRGKRPEYEHWLTRV